MAKALATLGPGTGPLGSTRKRRSAAEEPPLASATLEPSFAVVVATPATARDAAAGPASGTGSGAGTVLASFCGLVVAEQLPRDGEARMRARALPVLACTPFVGPLVTVAAQRAELSGAVSTATVARAPAAKKQARAMTAEQLERQRIKARCEQTFEAFRGEGRKVLPFEGKHDDAARLMAIIVDTGLPRKILKNRYSTFLADKQGVLETTVEVRCSQLVCAPLGLLQVGCSSSDAMPRPPRSCRLCRVGRVRQGRPPRLLSLPEHRLPRSAMDSIGAAFGAECARRSARLQQERAARRAHDRLCAAPHQFWLPPQKCALPADCAAVRSSTVELCSTRGEVGAQHWAREGGEAAWAKTARCAGRAVGACAHHPNRCHRRPRSRNQARQPLLQRTHHALLLRAEQACRPE